MLKNILDNLILLGLVLGLFGILVSLGSLVFCALFPIGEVYAVLGVLLFGAVAWAVLDGIWKS